MSVEYELGELRGELNGLKEEQKRLNTSICEFSSCFHKFKNDFQRYYEDKTDSKVGWRQYIWITGALVIILTAVIGLTFDMAEEADHRSQLNELRIEEIQEAHPNILDPSYHINIGEYD